METLADRPITRESILQMIETLNKETHRRFTMGSIAEVVRITAQSPVNALAEANCRLYCEDERLSLRGPGFQFNAINPKLCTTPVTAISPEELDDLLDGAAAGLNVEEGPSTNANQKAIKRQVMDSPGFRRGRQLLSNL